MKVQPPDTVGDDGNKVFLLFSVFVFQWPVTASYPPTIINTGVVVQCSVLSLIAHFFIDKMGIFNLTFKQVFELIF